MFSSKLTHVIISCELTKKIFFEVLTFFTFLTIFTYIFLLKENIGKNGQKSEKCQNFKKTFFRQFTRYDDMSKFGWKHVPPKCFEDLIILTNLLPVKTPSTFKTSWKNDVFWPTFSLQPKFSHVWSTSVDQTFFREFKRCDDMSMSGWNMSPRSVLNTLLYSQTYYS